MNLYLLSQSSCRGHDTYDSAVVAASDEAEARLLHPSGNRTWHHDGWRLEGCRFSDGGRTWPSPSEVNVTYLGPADKSVVGGIICASFNAG